MTIRVEESVTVNVPASTAYDYWHNFENLPSFMDHLRDVKVLSPEKSHWVAKAPLGTSVEWDAETVEDRVGEVISWRSLPDAEVQNVGSVLFKELPNGRGTEVHVKMEYNPPLGIIGAALAKLFGEEPHQQIRDDLRRFKQVMETGEIATIEGQPHGKAS